MSRENGFSVIELLITLLIVAILTAIAAPAFSTLLARQRVDAGMQYMLRSLAFARSEAIKRNTRISLVSASGRWEEGWQVFADTNENSSFDANEPLLLQQPPIGNFPIYGNTPLRRLVTYRGDGRSIQPSGAFQAGTIFFCPDDAHSNAYKLVIARFGRVRTEKLAAGNADCTARQGVTP